MESDRITEIIDEVNKGKNQNRLDSGITKEFLTIELDSNLFAIQLEYLREVFDLLNVQDIVPIPFTPSYIMGIINVREEIVPVLSLAGILGLQEKEHSYCKLAITEEKFKIAFPFKEIIDLKTISLQDIRECKDATKVTKEQFINQEFSYEGRVVRIIDILKLYASSFLV